MNNHSGYEYTVALTEQALLDRNYALYKQLVSVFYQYNEDFSPYFKVSKHEKLKDFIKRYEEEFYQYGFDFNYENERKYGVYSSGILVAYFDVENGFEIFIDEKIHDLTTFNQKKEKIKTEIQRLKRLYHDLKSVTVNPELIYQNELDYLLTNNHLRIESKKDLIKLIKKGDTLIIDNYLNHLNDLIDLNTNILNSFEKRFKNLNDFSYALTDLEHRKNLLMDMILQYSFETASTTILTANNDNDNDIPIF